MSKKIPWGEYRGLNMKIVDQVLLYEFKVTLSNNDWEGPCMCDPVDPMIEVKGHEMSVWLMMKLGHLQILKC